MVNCHKLIKNTLKICFHLHTQKLTLNRNDYLHLVQPNLTDLKLSTTNNSVVAVVASHKLTCAIETVGHSNFLRSVAEMQKHSKMTFFFFTLSEMFSCHLSHSLYNTTVFKKSIQNELCAILKN